MSNLIHQDFLKKGAMIIGVKYAYLLKGELDMLGKQILNFLNGYSLSNL